MKRFIPFAAKDPYVAIIRLAGAIGVGGRGSLSDAGLREVIEKAFAKGKPKAIALEINSPGGSPTQSSLIASRIRRLADEKDVPVYAFVEDVAASGGYWLACAADEIYVDQASVVGSIGVISAGFGAHVFLERQGIERRVYTAGKSKSMLDPFRPESEEDVARLKRLLEQMHGIFINHVKTARGDKLATEEDLFTGEIWVGDAARKVGLVDQVGHLVPVMKDKFGDKVKFRRFGSRKSLASRIGLRLAEDAMSSVNEQALFARYGL
ncbi:S49 family peptidase [Primorskyibacter sp. S187A]|uniref:S49 family peptidase n=1 Tax=Primorskyibacter sp. S187A TaxID=3415130 RepID=UPI003C79B5CC